MNISPERGFLFSSAVLAASLVLVGFADTSLWHGLPPGATGTGHVH